LPKKVLICDDEPYIRESVSYVAREEGFEVLTAEDGQEALETARRERPDLVFLDLMMPRKNGFQVCEALKEDDATREIYVIILTARGQEVDRERGVKVGADEYLTKPFSPRKLRQKMHDILDG
jgi:two-component system, OmpR family, alkaline phosphatase synthesis response regulator PhoP